MYSEEWKTSSHIPGDSEVLSQEIFNKLIHFAVLLKIYLFFKQTEIM